MCLRRGALTSTSYERGREEGGERGGGVGSLRNNFFRDHAAQTWSRRLGNFFICAALGGSFSPRR